MEKLSLSILGQSKEINDVEEESTIFLRDPFSASMTDLLVYCMKELAEALHLTVVHTYYQLPKHKWSRFYLVGYEARTGWSNFQKKIYDDPETCPEGTEIKWLLKNLRWYWRQYAKYMELNDDAFDDITGFLLFDVVNNAYADCETEMKTAYDDNLVQHCVEAALDLIIAITEATYYETIAEEVMKNRQNLEIMMPLISELGTYQMKQKKVQEEPLDTRTVLEFIRSSSLIQELEKEENQDNNPIDRPLTNYFLYTVMPRFEHLSLINDSGIESAACERSTNTNEQLEDAVNETLEELVNQTIDDENPFVTLSNPSLDIVPVPFINQTMDGSMIVINQYESTPIAQRHKAIDRLKNDTTITKITEDEDEEISSDDGNKSEVCDGSFVLI